jgi:hypothetical protein
MTRCGDENFSFVSHIHWNSERFASFAIQIITFCPPSDLKRQALLLDSARVFEPDFHSVWPSLASTKAEL